MRKLFVTTITTIGFLSIGGTAQAAFISYDSYDRPGYVTIEDANSGLIYDCKYLGSTNTPEWDCILHSDEQHYNVLCYSSYDHDNGYTQTECVANGGSFASSLSASLNAGGHRALPISSNSLAEPAPIENAPISTGSNGNGC